MSEEEEDAPTAHWPVPDYTTPPAARHAGPDPYARHTDQPRPAESSPHESSHQRPDLPRRGESPSPRRGDSAQASELPRRGESGRRSDLPRRDAGRAVPPDDDPETFTFDRPAGWDDAPSHAGQAAPPAYGMPEPAREPRPPLPPLPAWAAPPTAHEAPSPAASNGFSYWERREAQQTPGPSAAERAPRGAEDPVTAARERPHSYADAPPSTTWADQPAPRTATPGSADGTRTATADSAGWTERPGIPGQAAWGDQSPSIPAAAWMSRAPSGTATLNREAAWDDPAPETDEEPSPPPVKRGREPYLDNVKFLLIALVPAGHALVPTLAAHSARAAYLFIYVFHMPLFVIISGYLSRNFWNSNAKTNKLVDTFLVPYVIVEIGYAALRFALGHKWSLTIIDPAWLNWYLLALLLWRLSTPVWKRMRYPLPIAIAVYLLAGLSDLPGDFSMDRFFGLMPFFVLGLWLQPHHFEMLNRTWVKILAVFVLAGAVAVAILIAPHVSLDPIYYKDSYAELHLSWWKGMAMRAGLLVAALTVSMAILALVPRRKTWFSDLGTRTLYCYLLHGVPVLIAKEMGWLSFPWLYGPLGVLAIMSGAFALAILLCLAETRTLFKWLLEPRLVWLYRRPSAQASAGTN
ncbi:acyltransferase family protein [Sphaerisporangium fuscum]|uniref:acyltransferase family protein n=1 Tax=Sphaerisporangium fuscum TaxID=2835868 RepID=UPI001BDBFC93|nr:acyltransferase family protein [Sphaerisporangium fuscum]